MNKNKLKNVIEGFLFASDKALTAEQIVKLFPEGEQPEKDLITECINTLVTDFETHGIELKEVKSGYRFQVRQENASWVAKLWDEKPAKYTRAMLETLALIVYRQPITRGEIEEIRGVSVSSHIVRTLMDRDWVKIIGHRDVPGRPALFASTKVFLDYFNLTSLEELPPLSEIKDLDSIATELDPDQNAALISAIRDMQKDQAAENSKVSAPKVSQDYEEVVSSDVISKEVFDAEEDFSDLNEAIDETVAQAEKIHDEIVHNEQIMEEQVVQDEKRPKSFSDLISNFEHSESSTETNPQTNTHINSASSPSEEKNSDNEETSDEQKNSMESDSQ